MHHHQLAILQEKLIKLRHQKANLPIHKVSGHTDLDLQMRNVREKINQLGRKGTLKMAVVVVKTKTQGYCCMPDNSAALGPVDRIETFTFMFHDLDDESIYVLLEGRRANNQEILSKSVVHVPLGEPISSSLENNIISWQISSDI